MSEGPSDPDLLDLDDLPDTETVGTGPLSGMRTAIRGLGRWAVKTAKARGEERKELTAEREYIRGLATKVIVAVVTGALGMMGTVIGGAFYVGVRLERFETMGRRLDRLEERAWTGTTTRTHVDTTTHASEEP